MNYQVSSPICGVLTEWSNFDESTASRDGVILLTEKIKGLIRTSGVLCHWQNGCEIIV
jgi:hypothetical protein